MKEAQERKEKDCKDLRRVKQNAIDELEAVKEINRKVRTTVFT